MRILIVKLSAIGDVVHTLPAVAFLKRSLPDAHISWAVERRAAALLQGSPVIDNLLEIDTRALRKNIFRSTTLEALRAQLGNLSGKDQGNGFDVAIDFQGLVKSGVVMRAANAPRRIGFASDELREKFSRIFLTEQVSTSSHHHVIEKNLALARAVINSSATQKSEAKSVEAKPPSLSAYEFPITVSSADEQYIEEAVSQRYEKFAILNPGGGWATKLWSVERFAAIADWLWQEMRFTSLVTFGPGEEKLAQAVQSNSRHNTALPIPATLKQFVALARRAKLFVGGDTGPLHIAAACGTPVVGLYGPTAPARNGPFDTSDITVGRDLWCRTNCHKRKCWHWECMEISVEEVTQAIAERLGEKPIAALAFSQAVIAHR
ncbi:MAG: glycosyltransferase family 9 protein [Acidobacteria bacterium]|nr:glycosyltransferase family 9 protein [Acidobacteriota bacterium]